MQRVLVPFVILNKEGLRVVFTVSFILRHVEAEGSTICAYNDANRVMFG